MLGHVGQRLLRYPVGAQFHSGAVRPRPSGAVVADVKSSPAQLADERGQVVQRGRRCLIGILGVAELPEQVAQLIKRGPAGCFDCDSAAPAGPDCPANTSRATPA